MTNLSVIKKYLLLIAAATALTIGGIAAFENRDKLIPQPEETLIPMGPAVSEPAETSEPENVRKPAVAGSFYPGSAKELSAQIDELLKAASPAEEGKAPKILIVPHAGYRFSGQVAAYAFNEIKNYNFATVVLIGNSHNYNFDGAAVYDKGFFETPLGQVPINEIITQKLINEHASIFPGQQYHDKEHSLEVEIPFLQKTLKDFALIPIVLGDQTTETATALANALKKHADPYTLIAISTDLAHYPNYEDAKKSDQQITDSIVANDLEKFSTLVETLPQSGVANLQTAACASGAVKTALILSEKLGITDIQLLNYANSGDLLDGDKNRVVGYAALAFYTDRFGAELNEDERKELLKISRQTLETFLTAGQTPTVEVENDFLNTSLGAFVTLHRDEELRGCIGRFEPEEPLWKVVQQVAISAATEDRRFTPVQVSELEEIEIEISVLSPRRRTFDPQTIEVGEHGVSMSKDSRHGVFLPQVATENNWGLEKFLSELCTQKMGLSAACWQDPTTQIFTFTAQIFADELN